jgi:hypothetical protein
MIGGTYAEALKAGFTEEQAGFLGRFGGEIKDEARSSIHEELKTKEFAKKAKLDAVIAKIVENTTILAIGLMFGAVLTSMYLKGQL